MLSASATELPGKLTPRAFFSSTDDAVSALPMPVESDAVIIVFGLHGTGSDQFRASLTEAKLTSPPLSLTTEMQNSHVHEVQFSPDCAR
jgi:hypothetical protein